MKKVHWFILWALVLILAAGLGSLTACGDDDDDDDDAAADDDDTEDDDDAADDDAADDDATDDDATDDDSTDDDDDDEFTFGSSAFNDGDELPAKYTCEAGISPPLEWANPPEDTAAYALMLYDKTDEMYYWGVANIPAGTLSLAEGVSPEGTLPGDAFEAINDFGNQFYDGPCADKLKAGHDYELTLYALSEIITEPEGKGWCIHALFDAIILVTIISLTIAFSVGAG
jgi:phosphatidylethanolamine-binding protein (PEBP) family uncharacterized protein